MARRDDDRLAHMLAAARRAVSLAETRARHDLDEDDVLALALTHLLEILGEAAKVSRPRRRIGTLTFHGPRWRRRGTG